MGLVYYAHYYEYFEAARTELLRSIDLDVRQIEKDGYFLPVLTSHCNYLAGARFDDVLIVEAFITETPTFKIKIYYKITLEDVNSIVAEGYTLHVFTRQDSGKPCRIPVKFVGNLTVK